MANIAYVTEYQSDFESFVREYLAKNKNAVKDSIFRGAIFDVCLNDDSFVRFIKVSTVDDVRGRTFSDFIETNNLHASKYKQEVVDAIKLRMI